MAWFSRFALAACMMVLAGCGWEGADLDPKAPPNAPKLERAGRNGPKGEKLDAARAKGAAASS